MEQTTHPGAELAAFAAGLRLDAVPAAVLRRAQDFFIDWFASALAGKGGRPVETIARFSESMGPADGPSEVLIHRRGTSPLLAAMANAAASHFVEQDDVHNGSVFHPASVVFPAAMAVAQATGASGREFLEASIAGYEVGIRVGEFLGRGHYKVFHTTGTAGTLAAAAAVGHLLQLDPERMGHAFGSAGTQSAGLWEFLRDARRLEAAAHHARYRRRSERRLPGARRLHRRAPHLRRQRRAWPRASPMTPTPLACTMVWARAGRWPRPRSSSTPRAGTPILPPTRCCS